MYAPRAESTLRRNRRPLRYLAACEGGCPAVYYSPQLRYRRRWGGSLRAVVRLPPRRCENDRVPGVRTWSVRFTNHVHTLTSDVLSVSATRVKGAPYDAAAHPPVDGNARQFNFEHLTNKTAQCSPLSVSAGGVTPASGQDRCCSTRILTMTLL